MKVTWPTSANTSTKRVFVGLSGGVDSAVSAALLKQAGYEVVGVFIRITIDGYPCTAGVDKLDAMRVAAHLKIPFLSVDLSEQYKKRVFEASIAEFAKGRTPNPDTLCNKEIKFGLFFDWCMEQGADAVATGHYARLQDGSPALYMAVDPEKDQSYFLWAVPEEALRKTIFPVGGLTKTAVRKLAKKFGLPNAERKDSQGLCFLGPVSLQEMLTRELAPKAGAVLNLRGGVVGEHEGVALYTLGQRHGFTSTAKTPDTRPHFVVGKDVVRNTITISPERFPVGARETHVRLSDINRIGVWKDGLYQARYRYRQKLIKAELRGDTVVLYEPHYVPEGQSLVLYDGNRCLGGGSVDSAAII